MASAFPGFEMCSYSLTKGKNYIKLIKVFRKTMDKKMRKVTAKMRVAEKEVKRGEPKKAVATLKSAEKKNTKLADFDEKVRDPKMKKCSKLMKKK